MPGVGLCELLLVVDRRHLLADMELESPLLVSLVPFRLLESPTGDDDGKSALSSVVAEERAEGQRRVRAHLEVEGRDVAVLEELCEPDSVVREVLLLSDSDDLVPALGVGGKDLLDES